jgi:hypothetical protein
MIHKKEQNGIALKKKIEKIKNLRVLRGMKKLSSLWRICSSLQHQLLPICKKRTNKASKSKVDLRGRERELIDCELRVLRVMDKIHVFRKIIVKNEL